MSADPRVGVGCAALVWRDGHLLMMRRGPAASHGAGTWAVPGGWIDYGEDPGEAVLRELREETGLIGSEPRFVEVVANTHPEHDMHVVCTFYEVLVDHGQEPVNLEPNKADTLVWVPADSVHLMTPRFPSFQSLMDLADQRLVVPRRRMLTGNRWPL